MGGDAVRVREVVWSPAFAAAIARAAGEGFRAINSEAVTGRAQCWEIEGRGLMVTRLEVYDDGARVLVVVAGQGRRSQDVLRLLPAIARANGAQAWRVHSQRPGMGRLLRRAGLEFKVEPGMGETVFYGWIEK